MLEGSGRVWILTKPKPAGHFCLYREEHSASIANQVSSGDVHLELKGRGSSATGALPGIPEEPLHLLICAPSMEQVEAAKPVMEQLLVINADLRSFYRTGRGSLTAHGAVVCDESRKHGPNSGGQQQQQVVSATDDRQRWSHHGQS